MKKIQILLCFAFFSALSIVYSQQASEPVKVFEPDPLVAVEIGKNPKLVEEKLHAAMIKLLNNPKILEITVIPIDPESTKQGKFSHIKIHTENGTVDNMLLSKADVDFEEVHLNTTKLIREDNIETINVKSINMDVIVKEADLNSFLRAKAKKIKVDDPKVEMSPGKIKLSGSTRYSFVKVKFWATGVFQVNHGKDIWFHPKKLKVNSMVMPRAFVGTIVKRINPVLNLEKFPFRLNLRKIEILDRALRFTSSR